MMSDALAESAQAMWPDAPAGEEPGMFTDIQSVAQTAVAQTSSLTDLLASEPGATLAFVSVPSGWEWIIVGLIALLLFGSRLPHVARSLGGSLREFKKGVKEGTEGVEEVAQATSEAAGEIRQGVHDAARFEAAQAPSADGSDPRVAFGTSDAVPANPVNSVAPHAPGKPEDTASQA